MQVRVEQPGAISQVTLEVMGAAAQTQPVDAAEPTTLTFSEVDLSRWNATEDRVILRAVAESEAGEPLVSEPVEVLVDSRRAATERLADDSQREPLIEWDGDGFPSFVHVDIPAPAAEDPVEKGFQILEEYEDLFLIEDPRQVLAPGRVGTTEGRTEVLFKQHLDGMPVHSAALVVSFDETGERVLAFSGNYVTELPEPTEPRISREDADEIAMSDGVGERGERLFVSGFTRRVVYDPAIFDRDAASEPTVVWRVNVQGFDVEGGHAGHWEVFVDAQTGAVHRVADKVHQAIKELRVKVLNANGKTASDGASECMSKFLTRTNPACFHNINTKSDGCNSNADSDGEAADARLEAIDVHNWMKGKFGWISNDNGGIIKPIVNVTFSGGPNAQAMSGTCNSQMQFSNGWMVPDVFYHEFGHRLVRQTADFNSDNEPGALDEHFADMLGALIEGEEEGVGFDPVLGEELSGGAVRDASNPGSAGASNRGLYSNRYQGNQDNGGRHWNSTIPSSAMWRLFSGGQFRGFEIDAFDAAKVRTLLWRTLRSSMMNSSTNFSGYANAMINIARSDYSADDACQVRNAFASVQIVTGDSDCDGTLNNAESDNDADQTPDAADNCPQIYNTAQRDTDGDGRGDACDPDSDGDGVPDAEDNCPMRANSSQDDTDNNDVGDACEDLDGDLRDGYEDNCPMTENFLQEDHDGDGQGDACDSDDDNDGVDDSADNCPQAYNPTQGDFDNDGEGAECDDDDGDGYVNAHDPCPDTYSYPDRDRDDDGLLDACEDSDDDNDDVPDADDNCRFVANSGQYDTDEDGVGGACDNCPGTPNPEQTNTDGDAEGDACDPDDDGDGVDDGSDNCPLTPNARQVDGDRDGEGTACEQRNYRPWLHRQIEIAQSFEANFPSITDDGDPSGFTGSDLPIDVCKRAICRDNGYVPAGYEVDVDVEAGFLFRAAILDGEGNVVRRIDPEQLEQGESGDFGGTLTFEPPAGAYFATDAVSEAPFQGSAYRLRVVGHPEYRGVESAAVGVQISEGLPE